LAFEHETRQADLKAHRQLKQRAETLKPGNDRYENILIDSWP
jgi:hypothetical protein